MRGKQMACKPHPSSRPTTLDTRPYPEEVGLKVDQRLIKDSHVRKLIDHLELRKVEVSLYS